jgi:hypothetical protein
LAYSFKDNTYSTKPKDDPKDRIEVEIGDSKQVSDFLPQVKVMRWDNEVNLSLRLISDEDKKLKPTLVVTKSNSKGRMFSPTSMKLLKAKAGMSLKSSLRRSRYQILSSSLFRRRAWILYINLFLLILIRTGQRGTTAVLGLGSRVCDDP